MRKPVIFYLFLPALLFAKDVTIDYLLDKLNETSYQRKLYDLRKKRDIKNEKILKKSNYNGFDISVETDYKETDEVYDTIGKIKYGDFFIKGMKRKRDENNFIYGIEKNIKDFLYSKNDSELRQLDNTKKISEIDFKLDLEEQKIEFVKLYKDYLDTLLEIKLRQKSLDKLHHEKKILEKSYKVGNIAKVSLDSLLVTYKNIQLEIAQLKTVITNLTKQFEYQFEIKIANYNLLPINVENIDYNTYLKNIGKNKLNKSLLQKMNIEENIKFKKYSDSFPELLIGLERDTRYDKNRAFLKISKSLFCDNMELENEKIALEEKKF